MPGCQPLSQTVVQLPPLNYTWLHNEGPYSRPSNRFKKKLKYFMLIYIVSNWHYVCTSSLACKSKPLSIRSFMVSVAFLMAATWRAVFSSWRRRREYIQELVCFLTWHWKNRFPTMMKHTLSFEWISAPNSSNSSAISFKFISAAQWKAVFWNWQKRGHFFVTFDNKLI